MRRIAVPVKKGKLDGSFEQCKTFQFVDIKDSNVVKEFTVVAPLIESKALSEWLLDNRVTDVIVKQIKHKFVKICNLNKVNVFVGVQKEDLKEFVQDFIDGVLETNSELVEN